ncbi:General amino-acid permease GAP1 [Penicillium subrubescens]|nr:General amino-acid permease GAP1 [Penicillium subrubescens]
MAGEAESPRFSMAHATKLVPARVNFIYITSVIFVTILVPSNDPRLLGASAVAASPFIIAVEDAGIPGIGSLLNAGMMFGVLAIAAESVYLSSRVLRTMAHQKLIPERLAGVDDKGRPRLALIITSVVAVMLAYIQLSAGGLTVLNWLVSITSASFFTNWIIISITNWRFHLALKAQNDPLFNEVYAWKSSLWPLAPAWLMLISLLLLVCCIYAGAQPTGGAPFSANNFFQYTIGLILIIVATAGYKIVFRTPWRDTKTADCISGRRTLSSDELAMLDKYYNQPAWRRFFTYLQLW